MAFCRNCGNELTEGTSFCPVCGVAVDALNKKETEQRKTVYDGNLHKCPKCGEQLNAFVTVCPVCNYELRGTQTTSIVHEFAITLGKARTDEQKIELIKNFYIPNTKEDIYEFFILAYSNIAAGDNSIEAWRVKLEQAYLKAKLAFGNSEDYGYITELYKKTTKGAARKKANKSGTLKAAIVFTVGLAMIIGGLIVASDYGFVYGDAIPFDLMAAIGLIPFVMGLKALISPDRKKQR